MLGLERVLSEKPPHLASGTELRRHQVDALAGMLTELIAANQRADEEPLNGNGHVEPAEPEEEDADFGVIDEEGNRFWIRGPVSPREVARLLQLFHEANLQVSFGGEHEFLLALDAKETVIGGLYYRYVSGERAHMEKVVVGRKHRGKGISDGIMREFERRLRARGVKTLETGFFQPEYLRRYGFRTDPTSGGLVLELAAETAFRF
jgi:GNAT superfamily N-acetyltransferase